MESDLGDATQRVASPPVEKEGTKGGGGWVISDVCESDQCLLNEWPLFHSLILFVNYPLG